jgi:thiamine pyrophosphokinase
MPAEEDAVGTETVVVVAAGEGPALPSLPAGAVVIAADGGLDRAVALGLDTDTVVGDLDSVAASTLAAAQDAGVTVIRHPEAKDATDLELALEEAAALDPRRVVVVASGGGRLDHLLAALLLLGSDLLAGVEVDAHVGDAAVAVIREERVLRGRPGDTVTLVPLHGPAVGVRTDGLAYPLRGETLEPGSSRGVSNVFVAPEARITLDRGVLLAIRPDPHHPEAGAE